MSHPTLRELAGISTVPAALHQSALVIIDAQNTYTKGVMRLDGVEAALVECAALLGRARAAGRPIIHIVHNGGAGSAYDLDAEIGQIAAPVTPLPGELVIKKSYPSSFEKTDLGERLLALGAKDLILAGFMTHMCVNSTARAAFNNGFAPTVVASATATRPLPKPGGGDLTAREVHEAALAAIADLFAVVVPHVDDIPD